MTAPSSFYFGLINFAIFATALFFVLKRPLRGYFAARAVSIRDAVEAARRAEELAVARAKEIQLRLDHIDAEIADMKRQAKQTGEEERREIIQRAESFAAKASQDTELMVKQELQRLKKSLRNTTVDLAIVMAERILREQITPDDQGRLAQQFVQRLDDLH